MAKIVLLSNCSPDPQLAAGAIAGASGQSPHKYYVYGIEAL